MYKVFINDKEIVFERSTTGPKSLNFKGSDYQSVKEIVGYVKKNGTKIRKSILFESPYPYRDFKKFAGNFRIIKAAGGIVFNLNSPNEILMIYRLGKWDLPKGKIDKGEGVRTAALREVEEECGVKKLKITRKLRHTFHLYQIKGEWVLKQTSWFMMSCADKTILKPQGEEGIEKAEWVSPKKLAGYLPLSYTSIADLIKNELLGG